MSSRVFWIHVIFPVVLLLPFLRTGASLSIGGDLPAIHTAASILRKETLWTPISLTCLNVLYWIGKVLFLLNIFDI